MATFYDTCMRHLRYTTVGTRIKLKQVSTSNMECFIAECFGGSHPIFSVRHIRYHLRMTFACCSEQSILHPDNSFHTNRLAWLKIYTCKELCYHGTNVTLKVCVIKLYYNSILNFFGRNWSHSKWYTPEYWQKSISTRVIKVMRNPH